MFPLVQVCEVWIGRGDRYLQSSGLDVWGVSLGLPRAGKGRINSLHTGFGGLGVV